MQHLTEDKVKAALRAFGLPVPAGRRAASAQEARAAAQELGGTVVVKALIPSGRRGHADAIKFAGNPDEAEKIADELIGRDVNGFICQAVYLETKIDIADELYLSFVLEDFPAKVLASIQGGVDIEAVHRDTPEAIVATAIPPLKGLPVWDAVDLWERAGLQSARLPAVASLTAQLHAFFTANDGVMLEINPLAIAPDGSLHIVGSMLANEDSMFEGQADEENLSLDPRAERERRVIEANRNLPGGMVRYKELDGDIGMFVGGGGAGLHQHDLILEAGGKPANHTDASTINMDKVRALIDVILDNPNVNSLFISWHYQQMAEIDKRVIPAIEAIKERGIDPKKFPVVIRMFGRGEEEAREAAKQVDGIHYLPHGAPMTDGIELIVRLTEQARKENNNPQFERV